MDTLPDDVPTAVHQSFVNNCQGPVAKILNNSFLRDPEDSSEWGLTHHHEDLVFYPINEASWYLGRNEVDNCLTTYPSIVVRIVRDAAGTAVDLVIEEFNWEDRSPRFAEICMNLL